MILSTALQVVSDDEVLIHQTIFSLSLILLVICLFVVFLLLFKKASKSLPLGRMTLRLILCFLGLAIFTFPAVSEPNYTAKSNTAIEKSLDFIETSTAPATTSSKRTSSSSPSGQIAVPEEMGFMVGKFVCFFASAVCAFLALLTFPFVRKMLLLSLGLGCFFILLAPFLLVAFALTMGFILSCFNVVILLVLYLCTVLWILSKIPSLFSAPVPKPDVILVPGPTIIKTEIEKQLCSCPTPEKNDPNSEPNPVPRPEPDPKTKEETEPTTLRYPILIGALGQKKITVPTSIGRRELAHICEDASFVSSPQYNLIQEAQNTKQWLISPIKNVLNPTFLNGTLLREAKILQQGDMLSVKDMNTEESQAEVLVRFESKTTLSSKK